jgi:hypothetical protein
MYSGGKRLLISFLYVEVRSFFMVGIIARSANNYGTHWWLTHTCGVCISSLHPT